MILAAQATGADVPDEAQFKSLLDELLWKQSVNPESIAGDKKYGDVDVYVELLDIRVKYPWWLIRLQTY